MNISSATKLKLADTLGRTIYGNSYHLKYKKKLYGLIIKARHKYNNPSITTINYKGSLYSPYDITSLQIPVSITLHSNCELLFEFRKLIEEKYEHEKTFSKHRNYFLNAMAMCHTTNDIEQIFSQSILDILSGICNYRFIEKPCESIKFQGFLNKNSEIVADIKKQMLRNILMNGTNNEQD